MKYSNFSFEFWNDPFRISGFAKSVLSHGAFAIKKSKVNAISATVLFSQLNIKKSPRKHKNIVIFIK
jgi:hypothetical protein